MAGRKVQKTADTKYPSPTCQGKIYELRCRQEKRPIKSQCLCFYMDDRVLKDLKPLRSYKHCPRNVRRREVLLPPDAKLHPTSRHNAGTFSLALIFSHRKMDNRSFHDFRLAALSVQLPLKFPQLNIAVANTAKRIRQQKVKANDDDVAELASPRSGSNYMAGGK